MNENNRREFLRSAAMVAGAGVVISLSSVGVTAENMLFLVAAMCLVAAWLAQQLHRACD